MTADRSTGLADFVKREVDIQIVFFDSNKAISTRAGSAPGVVAACTLFRAVAIKHLERIPNLVVRTFESLDDPAWTEYRDISRPCLVLTSSGGVQPTTTDELVPERALIARAFVHALHSRGMGTAELSSTVLKDAKVRGSLSRPCSPSRSSRSSWSTARNDASCRC